MAAKKKKRPTPPPPPVRTAAVRAKAPAGTSVREQEREAARKAVARDALRRKLTAGGLVVAAGRTSWWTAAVTHSCATR